MDPNHCADILKHLEKQHELLTDAYSSMSHELHVLQVEEEMLMRKYYEFMTAHGLADENALSTNIAEDEETNEAGAIVNVTSDEQT